MGWIFHSPNNTSLASSSPQYNWTGIFFRYIGLVRSARKAKSIAILVNNVGGSSAPGGGGLALSDGGWRQTFNNNLFAAVRLDRALLPKMLEKGSGVIIYDKAAHS